MTQIISSDTCQMTTLLQEKGIYILHFSEILIF